MGVYRSRGGSRARARSAFSAAFSLARTLRGPTPRPTRVLPTETSQANPPPGAGVASEKASAAPKRSQSSLSCTRQFVCVVPCVAANAAVADAACDAHTQRLASTQTL